VQLAPSTSTWQSALEATLPATKSIWASTKQHTRHQQCLGFHGSHAGNNSVLFPDCSL
jgi:hypothetical protein